MKRRRPQTNRWILSTAILLCALGLLSLFQNCSQVRFLSLASETDLKSQNNGGGYGGKPDGDFYRFAPEFTCEGHEKYLMGLNISGTTARLTENKKLLCGAVVKEMDADRIDSSIYQNQIVGFEDGIFEAFSQAPQEIPANLVEVWCRDHKDQTGIETITHFDRKSSLAVNRIYYATKDQSGTYHNQSIPDFSVSRLITETTITVKDGNGFELTVHRDQPAAELGLFKAQLTALIEGQSTKREVQCRVGGSLDSSIWPVKKIVDLNVLYLKQSPDQKTFSFTALSFTDPNKAALYSSSWDGSNATSLSQDLSISNGHFQFAPNSQKIVYMNDGLNPSSAELYAVGINGTSPVLISQDITGATNYSISSDSQNVIFNSGQLLSPWLKSVPIDGGLAKDLNPPLTPLMSTLAPSSVQTHYSDQFALSPVSSSLAFICCNQQMDLYASSAEGPAAKKINLPVPAGYVMYGVTYPSKLNDQLLRVATWTDALRGAVSYIDFAISIDGSISRVLPQGWLWSQTSPSGDFILLLNLKDRTTQQLMNLKTGALQPIPLKGEGSSYFFTQDSRAYVGLLLDSQAKSSRAVSISTASGSVSDICPNVSSLFVTELESEKYLIVSNPLSSQKVDIYISGPNSSCRLVNSIAVDGDATQSLTAKVSPDQQNLILKRQSLSSDGVRQDQLYFAPLDGRPAAQISSPVFKAATIQSFNFSIDSKSVVFEGDQTRPGEKNVFLWKSR